MSNPVRVLALLVHWLVAYNMQGECVLRSDFAAQLPQSSTKQHTRGNLDGGTMNYKTPYYKRFFDSLLHQPPGGESVGSQSLPQGSA